MKPSHFQAPRTLHEGLWDHGGEAFHHFPEPSQHTWDDIALVAIAAIVVFGIAFGVL